MLSAGPDVSLNGSPTCLGERLYIGPELSAARERGRSARATRRRACRRTVSPTMHALPWSVFLILSFSHSFLPLSHAPPALLIMMAIMHPDAIAPAFTPIRQRGPTKKPTKSGARIAYAPGATISRTCPSARDRAERARARSPSDSELTHTPGGERGDARRAHRRARRDLDAAVALGRDVLRARRVRGPSEGPLRARAFFRARGARRAARARRSRACSGGIALPSLASLIASISVSPRAFVTSRNWRRTSSMISAAALPTEIIVSAAKRNGSIAPNSMPLSTIGSPTESCAGSSPAWFANAASRLSAVSTALPIAKPLPARGGDAIRPCSRPLGGDRERANARARPSRRSCCRARRARRSCRARSRRSRGTSRRGRPRCPRRGRTRPSRE